MELTLNGEKKKIREGMTVAGLLEDMCIPRERVAVEVNLHIIRKAEYDNCTLQDGDTVEIVSFVGGG